MNSQWNNPITQYQNLLLFVVTSVTYNINRSVYFPGESVMRFYKENKQDENKTMRTRRHKRENKEVDTVNKNDNFDILVVDDNLEQANIIKLLIEQYGFKAQFTTDSEVAYQKILKDRPRLVILDLMMPEIDGLRLCKMIKENPHTADTRVIIYSGKLYESDRRKALALGADLFLTKPTRAYILLDAIKNLLLPSSNEVYQN